MRKAKLLITAIVALAMLAIPGTALARHGDRDHDKLPDKWEKKFHISTHKKSAKQDPDRDGLNNRQEFKDRTNPRDADTDNDGMDDGDEVEVGDNPRDRDTDNDGVEDGDETAGTIQSFDSSTGVLTILLADGTSTRSGTVNGSTRIECENEAENENEAGDDSAVHAADHGGDDNSGDSRDGDNSGPGSTSSGPGSGGSDDGDRGEDDRQACTTADLTPGRVVHEAESTTDANGNVTFTKVELDR